ncbi:hypothetical protein ACFLTI_06020 [Bacteroidota bacterium]
MKKIISIIGIIALIGVGIMLSPSYSGKSEVYNPNMGASFAPDKTMLKVTNHDGFYSLDVKVYMISDYNSEYGGISYGWVYPSKDSLDVNYFNMGWLAEYQTYTYARIRYKINQESQEVDGNIYMDYYNNTRNGGIGSAVNEFRVNTGEIIGPDMP